MFYTGVYTLRRCCFRAIVCQGVKINGLFAHKNAPLLQANGLIELSGDWL